MTARDANVCPPSGRGESVVAGLKAACSPRSLAAPPSATKQLSENGFSWTQTFASQNGGVFGAFRSVREAQ